MRITFVSNSLSCGGAERVVCSLSEALLRRKHSISVVTLSNLETDFFALPNEVTRVALNLIADVRAPTLILRARDAARRLRSMRRTFLSTRPDVVISSLQHVNVLTLLALAGTPCPVVVSEHSDPTMMSCGRPWDELRRITYGRTAKLVSVSRGVDQHFSWLPQSRRIVISNPLPIVNHPDNPADVPAILNEDGNWVMTMGRLSREKGFDVLLSAFARVAENNPSWRLMILGEGDQRPELERLTKSLGLRDRVALPGSIRNPFPVLKQAKLFVLPSRHEGFANVLIEAMACGVPVVASDCPSGPSEIVRDGKNGVLVPSEDVTAMAAALARLMADEGERARLALCGAETVKRYDIEDTVNIWEKMLFQITSVKQPRPGTRSSGRRFTQTTSQ
jgi:GalNAc-alpha-(1->4)-GalNAc-alpha-(1->3)-diNAcBac-PP-undecaprenol alpha-1,4-N-acetyl-D-galactosaminyltransferase